MATYKPEVKRYDMSACPEHICRALDMQESEDGDFVEWEAYEALQAECEKLRKDAERYRHIRGGCDMSDYKLVPVKPTIEMAFAGIEVYGIEECADADVHSVWEAMIAAAPAVQGEPVSHDWDDQDKCRLCGDRDWYASATCTPKQQPAPDAQGEPDVAGLVEALTELCDEIDKHEIHAAISETSISWFKRKARKALAAHRKQRRINNMSELLSQLQQLGDGEIDDLSIAHDASEEIVALRLRVAGLVEALEKARDAIASLPKDALGNVPDTQQCQGWHIRDELINDISTALAAYRKESSNE